MANTLLCSKLLIDLMLYFESINLTFIYDLPTVESESGFNEIRLKSLVTEINSNFTCYSRFLNLDRVNDISSEIMVDERTSHTIFIVYLSSIRLRELKEVFSKVIYKLKKMKWIFFVEENKLNPFYIISPQYDSEVFIIPRVTNETLVNITEVYKKSKEGQLLSKSIGVWNPNTRLLPIYKTSGVSYRRNSLTDTIVRVTTMENYPTVTLDNQLAPTRMIGGFFAKIWYTLEEELGFTTKLMVPPDGSWGTRFPNGSWSGMIGQIIRDEADFSLTDFSITLTRIRDVSFTAPIMTTPQALTYRKSDSNEISWMSFLAPFHPSVWYSIILMVILVGNFALFLNYRNKRKEKSDCFLDIFSIFCQQGCVPEFPRTTVGYLFYTFLYYIGILILVAYSAILISFLTVLIFRLPFTNLKEFLNNPNYKLTVMSESSKYYFFAESSDPLVKAIFKEKMDNGPLPPDYVPALKLICNSSQAYAFFSPTYPVNLIIRKTNFCQTGTINVGLLEGLGIVAQKLSPYLDTINHNLLQFRDFGILKRLELSESRQIMNEEKNPFTGVRITSVTPMFLIVLGGIGLSVFICFLEIFIMKLALRHRSNLDRIPFQQPNRKKRGKKYLMIVKSLKTIAQR